VALLICHDDGSVKFVRNVITLPSTCRVTEVGSVFTGALNTAGSLH
jgi:hypothetical protein